MKPNASKIFWIITLFTSLSISVNAKDIDCKPSSLRDASFKLNMMSFNKNKISVYSTLLKSGIQAAHDTGIDKICEVMKEGLIVLSSNQYVAFGYHSDLRNNHKEYKKSENEYVWHMHKVILSELGEQDYQCGKINRNEAKIVSASKEIMEILTSYVESFRNDKSDHSRAFGDLIIKNNQDIRYCDEQFEKSQSSCPTARKPVKVSRKDDTNIIKNRTRSK